MSKAKKKLAVIQAVLNAPYGIYMRCETKEIRDKMATVLKDKNYLFSHPIFQINKAIQS